MNEFDFELPEGVDEKDLIPDPSKRPGCWYHEATDQTIACPIGWKPAHLLAPEKSEPSGPKAKD